MAWIEAQVVGTADPFIAAIDACQTSGDTVTEQALLVSAELIATYLHDDLVTWDQVLEFTPSTDKTQSAAAQVDDERFDRLPAWAQIIERARRLREGRTDLEDFTKDIATQEGAGPTTAIPMLNSLARFEAGLAQRLGQQTNGLASSYPPRAIAFTTAADPAACNDPAALGHVLADRLASHVLNQGSEQDQDELMGLVGDTESRVPRTVEYLFHAQAQLCDAVLAANNLRLDDLLGPEDRNRSGLLDAHAAADTWGQKFVDAALGFLPIDCFIPPISASGAEEPDPGWVPGWTVAATRDTGGIEAVSTFTYWAKSYYLIDIAGTIHEADLIYWKIYGLASFANNQVLEPNDYPSLLIDCLRARLDLTCQASGGASAS